jgi:hypothetical protein
VKKKPPASEAATVTLPGTVEKVIKSPNPKEPDKAQIAVEGADELYREIRIDNALQDEKGKEVALKVGTEVEVTVEAPADGTTAKENISDKK